MPTKLLSRLCGTLSGALAVVLLAMSMPVASAPGDTVLISTAPGSADHPAISRDGRYVVFQRSGHGIQRHDRLTGITERVDRATDGQSPDADGAFADLSADGRFVTFVSSASNLVAGDSNANGPIPEIYVRDMQTGSTARVSVGPHGEEANSGSYDPHVSADGRLVAFMSYATNLVAGYGARGHVFLWDRQTGVVERITTGEYGEPANDNSGYPAISEDGRYVAFVSRATNLIEGFCCESVYVRDRWLGLTEPATVTADGRPPNGPTDALGLDISADGRFVVFPTYATNLAPNMVVPYPNAQIIMRDRVTGVNEVVSATTAGALGNQPSWHPRVSADGRFVVFETDASNLVHGDTFDTSDVFVRDRLTGSIQRVSVDSAGAPAPGAWESYAPRISADGHFVVFATSRKLSPRDTDNERDVYVHEIAVTEQGPISYALSPQAMTFGVQTVTAGRTQSFLLRNTGTTALPVGAIALTGENSAVFSLAHNCPASIAVGAGCAISVTFRPTWVGNATALVKVAVANNAVTTRAVTGAGVRAQYSLLPTALSFGSQRINTTSAGRYVKVTNTGSGNLPIESIYLSGRPDAWQFVRAHNCPSSVPVGGSCTVRVYFKPWSIGSKSATLTVWAGGYAGPKAVALTGTGATPDP